MRVLFLVWSSYPQDKIYADPSVFYRCFHPAEAMRRRGITTTVMHYESAKLENLAEYDYTIFFRPQFSEPFLRLFEAADKLNLPCIASYDDLFFDIEMLRQSNFRGLNAPQHKILASRPYNYAQAMYFFDTFISSTDVLSTRIETALPESKVHIMYNSVSEEMFALAKLSTETIHRVPRRIGYFAGGASHGPDLLSIAPQLARALEDSDAEFFCVETINVPNVLRETGRVVTTPRMSYAEMIMAYATCTTTIAPLHVNPFTESKSGIKYLEAALVGASAAATPIPDIMRIADERLIPVKDWSDWHSAIIQAVNLPSSQEITEQQQSRIRESYSSTVEADKLLSFLNKL